MSDGLRIHGVQNIKVRRSNLGSCETIEIDISSETWSGHERDFNITLFSQDEKFPFSMDTIPSDVKVDLFDVKKEEEKICQ